MLTTDLPHRAIGVVYDPEHDHVRNYVPTRLGGRYDAFLWLDETRALHPLHTQQTDTLEPETFPTGSRARTRLCQRHHGCRTPSNRL
ncbi:erythromycin esterase family protein [Lentzea flaviverrucosa]|uniref:erythromycin esterase family protein n=1 Tax=Lentzea flaviverrucosa TaxID=200379 RepID=UPI0034E96556